MVFGKTSVNWYEQSENFRTFLESWLFSCPPFVTSSGILAALLRFDCVSRPDDILLVVRESSRVIMLRPVEDEGLYTFLGTCKFVGFEYSQELFSNKTLKGFVIA